MINKTTIMAHNKPLGTGLTPIYEHDGVITVHGQDLITGVYVSSNKLVVCCNMPARIDHDRYLDSLSLLTDERAKLYDKPHSILTSSPIEAVTVWQREVTQVAEA